MPNSKDRNKSYRKNHIEVRKIFGKNIRIECCDEYMASILYDELSLYPAANQDSCDFILQIVSNDEIDERIRSFNDEEYIFIPSKIGDRYFIFEGTKLIRVLFTLNKPLNNLHGWIQRFRNMGFNRREERIGQIIHELVLVPSVLFDDHVVPIHSSAVKFNNQVVLFGGSGGVGKTSLELELCFHRGAHFIADDISVVSKGGMVYPNLSYPKIYGYNVEGQERIKNLVINKSDFFDRLHWNYHYRKGPNKVRRRVSPKTIYGKFENQSLKVDRYLILDRCEGEEFSTRKISVSEASERTVKILKEELAGVLEQLNHQKNCRQKDFKKEAILERWTDNLNQLLSCFRCEMISIPKTMPHSEFKKKMLNIF